MDFSLALLIALAVTGVIILWHRLRPRRAGGGPAAHQDPVLVEYAKTFFPVILLVLLLRSFVIEPFRIPSGSMLPNLHIGDFILVNKYEYGLRLPVVHWKIVNFGAPERGDVIVFRFPRDPGLNYIKRVVGLPGDRIRYLNKNLYINDRQALLRPLAGDGGPLTNDGDSAVRIFNEQLGGNDHHIQIDANLPAYTQELMVPDGHYFVMGDNRDNSHDSRVWGYVSEELVVGRAFFIWFSWNSGVQWSRIGNGIR